MSGLYDDSAGPSRSGFAVTPSDTVALASACRALYVGTAGNITLRLVDDSADLLFKAVPAGSVLPFRVSYVRATGTAAADIVALR